MPHPEHHKSYRKRAKKIADTRLKKILDDMVFVLGVGNIFATLPQVYEVWGLKATEGVSTTSWTYYTVFAFVLFIYGVVHKEKPIIVTYVFSFVLYGSIAIGSVLY